MAVEVQIKIKNLKEIKSAFHKAPALMTKNLNEAIRQTIFFVESRAVSNAPARTARLRGSAYRDFQPLRGEVGFKAFYALYVHEGTKAHLILPSKKKALFWKGAAHPMRAVRHPGTKANPFLRKAIEQSEKNIDKFFEQAVENTLNTIAKESN